MSNHPGSARELPALTGFEDSEEPDLGALLKRRGPVRRADDTGSTTSTAPSEPVRPDVSRVEGDTPEPQPHPGPNPTSEDRPRPTRTAPTKPTEIATRVGDRPAAASDDETSTTPVHSERRNRIRSSSVHVPTSVLEHLVEHRESEGLSNGDIVIAALEHAHPRLEQLIQPPSRAGGALFADRAARSVRTTDGPLTPLNVRLYEDDFRVIDELVAQFGAFSRGHLISVALTDFLTNGPRPPSGLT